MCALILAGATGFSLAVATYLPAVLFLLVILCLRDAARKRPVIGLIGLILTLVAAGVQVGEVALHPMYFNHNALYHLIQALALVMIFAWASAELRGMRRPGVVTLP